MPISATNANIARYLTLMAEQLPEQPALKIPRGRTATGKIDYLTLNFRELAAEVSAWRAQLTRQGVRRGDRTLVMVKSGLPLIAAVFALFQIGAVPVVIDPGMGLKHFLSCVRRTQPRVLVGIPVARLISRIFRKTFRSIRVRVRASGSLIERIAVRESSRANSPAVAVESAANELAAILFTSGSTGAPKGVCYEHGMFDAQVNLIRETYQISPGEIDLPLLPIFALFNPALGMTSVIPEIDPRYPARVDPEKIVQAIQQEKITNSFGSPTLWKKMGDHCRTKQITLPTLKRVLCAGAPVPAALWTQSSEWLTTGRLQSPYGATEALPISTIAAHEVEVTSVRGACVGRPLAGIEIKIIAITDQPILSWDQVVELAPGLVGEIIVRGDVVTKTYDSLPEATAAAKIPAMTSTKNILPVTDAPVWHRMGDCGYFDPQGRLWFCGRKAERVMTVEDTLQTEPCEQVFRSHPEVTRCALIGLGERGQQQPAMVIEGRASAEWVHELRALGKKHPHTAKIETFYFHPAFPVDVRHNAKIHRLTLARWAATTEGRRAALHA